MDALLQILILQVSKHYHLGLHTKSIFISKKPCKKTDAFHMLTKGF